MMPVSKNRRLIVTAHKQTFDSFVRERGTPGVIDIHIKSARDLVGLNFDVEQIHYIHGAFDMRDADEIVRRVELQRSINGRKP